MNVFRCSQCQQRVFFENSRCMNCEARLAYLPLENRMAALERDGERWRELTLSGADVRYHRLCFNYSEHDVCNWVTDAEDIYCTSCQLTRTIPNLDAEANRFAWFKLELAKRRLVYSLLALGLPVINKGRDPDRGLAYAFLSDDGADEPIMTGHAGGVITVNPVEPNDAERERRKHELGEPYRTLIGHLRHEVGHYYWERVVPGRPHVDGFRQLFGDEREDYGAALKRHYAHPLKDWQTSFISHYVSAQP